MNYNWNWSAFLDATPEGNGTYLDTLIQGGVLTLWTALISFALAFVLGSIIGILRTLPGRRIGAFSVAYVELFRNIPLLMQMFLWYFVLPEALPADIGRWIKGLPDGSFYTAVICLGFYTSSRVAEQVRAGILALPPGQKAAGLALGLSRAQTYRYVLLPMAYRMILPPLTSEFLNNTKNTSVALTIGLLEITARARAMQEFSFQVFEAFAAATVFYLAINMISVQVMHIVERRLVVPGSMAGGK